MTPTSGLVSTFIDHHFRHFNAAVLKDAANAYTRHVDNGGRMLLTLAGAMSTAELGLSLAEMIRRGKVHAISCTGANLEEDVFNLVAHSHYERIPHYRELTAEDEQRLLDRHLNRVTDTCIPEEEAMRRIERIVIDEWLAAEAKGERLFPARVSLPRDPLGGAEAVLRDRSARQLAGRRQRSQPAYVRSRLGGLDAGQRVRGAMHLGPAENAPHGAIGHRIHDGADRVVSGHVGKHIDRVFPDRRRDRRRFSYLRGSDARSGSAAPQRAAMGYFCQISDSTTSYGSYSGAVPNEKITWGKLAADTPKFMIESDATIVAPLVFAKVLGW